MKRKEHFKKLVVVAMLAALVLSSTPAPASAGIMDSLMGFFRYFRYPTSGYISVIPKPIPGTPDSQCDAIPKPIPRPPDSQCDAIPKPIPGTPVGQCDVLPFPIP